VTDDCAFNKEGTFYAKIFLTKFNAVLNTFLVLMLRPKKFA